MSTKKIFVSNLRPGASEADLRAVFGPFGTVTRVRIPVDTETGALHGFAFVEMADAQQAEAAIAGSDGHLLRGWQLQVRGAIARPGLGGFGYRSPRAVRGD